VSEILRAHAKINLVLRVGPVRQDGFHRIATLFQGLELHDELELEAAAETTVEGFDDTLVTRALELLGEPRRVVLRKRIPVAGGLGGGSSDAAAVLRSFAGERTVEELYAMARQLGSDVPFFLSGLETAVGTGRGDVLQPMTQLPRRYGVVLVPSDGGLSTADVYAAAEPNPIFDAVRGDLLRGVRTARDVEGLSGLVANDLEPAALRLRPDLADRLAELRDAGALAAAVSGSGPTVFGLFPDRTAAKRAATGIEGAIATAPL
jgi:4-diphosphocytidyl-2-C-methyl-D-erythritol kinase